MPDSEEFRTLRLSTRSCVMRNRIVLESDLKSQKTSKRARTVAVEVPSAGEVSNPAKKSKLTKVTDNVKLSERVNKSKPVKIKKGAKVSRLDKASKPQNASNAPKKTASVKKKMNKPDVLSSPRKLRSSSVTPVLELKMASDLTSSLEKGTPPKIVKPLRVPTRSKAAKTVEPITASNVTELVVLRSLNSVTKSNEPTVLTVATKSNIGTVSNLSSALNVAAPIHVANSSDVTTALNTTEVSNVPMPSSKVAESNLITTSSVVTEPSVAITSRAQTPLGKVSEVTTTRFPLGSFVWAQLRTCRLWPGVVQIPDFVHKEKVGHTWVLFLGSMDYGLVNDERIFPYKENRDRYLNKYKRIIFKEAVSQMDRLIEESESNGTPYDGKIPPIPPNAITMYGRLFYLELENTMPDGLRNCAIANEWKSICLSLDNTSTVALASEILTNHVTADSSLSSSPVPSSPSPSPGKTLSGILKKTPCSTEDKFRMVLNMPKHCVGIIGLEGVSAVLAQLFLFAMHKVAVWDRNLGLGKKMLYEAQYLGISENWKVCNTPDEVCNIAETIFICMPNTNLLYEVLHMRGGLAQYMERRANSFKPEEAMNVGSKVVVFMSHVSLELGTLIPTWMYKPFVDVLHVRAYGDVEAMHSAKLYLFVSGDRDAFKRCRNCLYAISEKLVDLTSHADPMICHKLLSIAFTQNLLQVIALYLCLNVDRRVQLPEEWLLNCFRSDLGCRNATTLMSLWANMFQKLSCDTVNLSVAHALCELQMYHTMGTQQNKNMDLISSLGSTLSMMCKDHIGGEMTHEDVASAILRYNFYPKTFQYSLVIERNQQH